MTSVRQWLYVCAFFGGCLAGGCAESPPPRDGLQAQCDLECGAVGRCEIWGDARECRCPSGYQFDEVARECEDIDECNTESATACMQHQVCTNTLGSYDCGCPDGLKDSGVACVDDEFPLQKFGALTVRVSGSLVNVTWDEAANADYYDVHMGTQRGFSPSETTRVATVRVAEWEGELPLGPLVLPAISASPFDGVPRSLRNDGVSLRLQRQPSRDVGEERYIIVVPRQNDVEENLGLASLASRAQAQSVHYGCQWQVRLGTDPTARWTGVTVKADGQEWLHETDKRGRLDYRCVPTEAGTILPDFQDSSDALNSLSVVEGRVGFCDDGLASDSRFETYTDCGGVCGIECTVPLYDGETGPFVVYVGDDVGAEAGEDEGFAIDITFLGVPKINDVEIQHPDFMSWERTSTGRTVLSVPAVADGVGTHAVTITATNEVGVATKQLTVVVRPRRVDHLAMGSFGCAVIEGNFIKCFGQNPQGILGRGDGKNPGVMTPVHHVSARRLASPAGRVEEAVLDISVGRDTACALLRDRQGARRLSCWGGNEDGMPTNPLAPSDPPASLVELLHSSQASSYGTVFGDVPLEVPGALTVDSAISNYLGTATRVIVGRPWICVTDETTLWCEEDGVVHTVDNVLGVWVSAGLPFSCVATRTGAWCGNGAPKESGRGEGAVTLPSSASLPIVNVGMVTAHQALAVQDSAGSVYIGRLSAGDDGVSSNGFGDFSSTPQFQNADQMIVALNGVCAIAGENAFCWGSHSGFWGVGRAVTGLGAIDSDTPDDIAFTLAEPDDVVFEAVEGLSGSAWSMNQRSVCAWRSGQSFVQCRESADGGAASVASGLNSAMLAADECLQHDWLCGFKAILGGLAHGTNEMSLARWYGASSLRPGWIPPEEEIFVHELVFGAPVSYGPQLPTYLPRSRDILLPLWVAESVGASVEMSLSVSGQMQYEGQLCDRVSAVQIDGEKQSFCGYVREDNIQAGIIEMSVGADDGYHSAMSMVQRIYSTTQPDVVDIAVGNAHSCAVRQDGTLYCWGSNNFGQLGIPDLTADSALTQKVMHTRDPRRILEGVQGMNITRVEAGRNHTCVVEEALASGVMPEVICVGDNQFGAAAPAPGSAGACASPGGCGCVGPGCIVSTYDPANAVQFGLDAVGLIDLQLGDGYSCAIVQRANNEHVLSCWGDLRFMNTGDEDARSSTSPVPASCGVLVHAGDPVNGSANLVHFSSSDYFAGRSLVSVGAGPRHLCVLYDHGSGRVSCVGDNRSGQLGLSLSEGVHQSCFVSATQSVLNSLQGTPALGAGRDFTCIMGGIVEQGVANASAMCWGGGLRGQLGNGSFASPGLNALKAVRTSAEHDRGIFLGASGLLTVGTDHACMATTAGVVYCWGENRIPFAWNVLLAEPDSDDSQLLNTNGDLPETFGRLGAGLQQPFSNTAVFVGVASGGVAAMDTYGSSTCVAYQSGELRCFGGDLAGEDGRSGRWGSQQLGLMGPSVHFDY